MQLVNMLIILPSIVLLTVILYEMNLHQAEERALRSSYQEIKLISSNINTMLSDIENFSKLAIINHSFQTALNDGAAEDSPLQELDDIQRMYASLNSFVESNSFIDSVVIQSIEGSKVFYSNNITNVTHYTLSTYPREKLLNAKGSVIWIETYLSLFHVDDNRKNLLSVGRRILNTNTGMPMGYLYINVDERKMSELFGSDGGIPRKVMLINSDGMIISATDPELVLKSATKAVFDRIVSNPNGSYIFREGNKDILVASKVLNKNGWRVVYEVPTEALMQDQWKITVFIIGFGIAGLLLALILSILFSNWITKPIIRLSRTMTAVGSGRLNMRTSISSKDEIGVLSYRFNEMVDRIQDLLQKVNMEEKQKRELELRLMYSQIKPHFLYNTLEMIRSMALMVQAKDIGKVVKALGDFYRMSLNKGHEWITVKQERKHLESYLTIQQMRYNHIEYRIIFEPDIEEYWIPSMLLQPLVENAVYHGLRDKRNGALCEVLGSIEKEGGRSQLIFIVRDNGSGMTEEQVKRIWSREREQSAHDLSSFGIHNIQERIDLRFGSSYGLKIISTPGEGVEIQLRIPILHNEGNEGADSL